MAGHLRAVRDGERPKTTRPPRSLAEATDRSRLELLVKSRETIAKTIDAGVPAHALARLINEMNGIDADIRRLEADEKQEAQRRGSGERRSFNQDAI